MNTNWYLEPVTQVAFLCGILGVGLIGSLTLWISAKIDAKAVRKEVREFRLATEATILELKSGIDELRKAPLSESVPSASLVVQGLNLTDRTKALRMHSRGESIFSIAGSLGVPQEEIQLLLKLDHLLEVPGLQRREPDLAG
jgi:hypothetical protein